jgi:hypothetical protein
MSMTRRTEGDSRMLGACDGMASALIWVRQHINAIDGPYARRIEPRHRRKRAARDAVLRPLKELEARLLEAHGKTLDAYRKTSADGETEDRS